MKLTNPSELKNIIAKHGFTFSKSLGQNFLIDDNVLNAILDGSGVNKECGALEIGPGAGVLTRSLAERAKKVVTVEIDKTLMPILNDTLSEFDNTIIINEDEYIPHIELYSMIQNDLENIIKRGVMHDIIIPKRE